MIGAKTGKVRKRFLKPCARCEVQFRPKSSTGKLCEACIEKSKHRPKNKFAVLEKKFEELTLKHRMLREQLKIITQELNKMLKGKSKMIEHEINSQKVRKRIKRKMEKIC